MNAPTANAVALVSSHPRPIEIELLLCCARTCIGPAEAARIKVLLQGKVDWIYLIQLAFAHGVLPLLYGSLHSSAPESVPKSTLKQFRAFCEDNARRGEEFTRELFRILDLLNEHKIPAIPFKGPVLAMCAYGDLALRQFNDLDLLVHKTDFLKAKDILIRDGYGQVYFGEHEMRYRQSQLVRSDRSLSLDLHWGITPLDFFLIVDPESMWQDRVSVALAGREIRALSPENTLLLLFVHGSKEGWKSLNRLCDMNELIRASQRLNWESLMARIRTGGGERNFLLGLRIVSDFLGTPIPDSIQKRIERIPLMARLARQIETRLFSDVESVPADFEKLLLEVGMIDGARRRSRRLVRFALTSSEADRSCCLPLPECFSRLSYLVRPIRLALKCARRPIETGRTLKALLGF